KFLPFTKKIPLRFLPPGAEIVDYPTQRDQDVLLYIGGLGGDHYRLNAAFEGVINDDSAQLIVCTREAEWTSVRNSYPEHPSISIVHLQGKELSKLYNRAKYTLLFMTPTEYRKFAVP